MMLPGCVGTLYSTDLGATANGRAHLEPAKRGGVQTVQAIFDVLICARVGIPDSRQADQSNVQTCGDSLPGIGLPSLYYPEKLRITQKSNIS